ncbi:MAG: ABC transporter ATP-binding protein [Vampirovibrionales bacterium]|nr:ABC transporter ATP-binding protein [Vampirovibrionales bacterium]
MQWALYRRIYRYVHPYLGFVALWMLLTLPIGTLDAAIAFSLRPYADTILVKQSISSVSLVPFVIVGFTLVQGLLNYGSIYLGGWLGSHILNNIRQELFEKLQTMDVCYFDQTPSGMVIQRYLNDPQVLQSSILNNFKDLTIRLVASISLIFVLLYTSWKLAIVAIVILMATLIPSTRIRKSIRGLNLRILDITSNLISFYTETTMGIRVVYGYNLHQERLTKFKAVQNDIHHQNLGLFRIQGRLTPTMHFIASIGIALIIWQGSQLVVTHQLTTGAFVSFLAALVMLYNPIKNLGNSLFTTQNALMAAERVFEIMDLQPTVQSPKPSKPIGRIQKGISLENVSFSYTNGIPVLKDISLQFRVGETVALVGNSGGGKSTIASLIPRFYDVQSGAITIDGVDIRDVDLADLRHQIAMVTQDNFLFNGSLRENILMGNPEASEADIMDVVDKAYLSDFIQELPAGLETLIGERGIMLSGGQRQRVAIARALLKNAPIVILDEATSALDNQSEAVVQKALEALMVNRTVIVIAHRLSTIRNAHRVVVIDGGNVMEEGSHDALLAQGGMYASLYNLQFQNNANANSTIALPEEALV